MSEEKYVSTEDYEKDVKDAHGAGLYVGAILGFMVGIATMILISRSDTWITTLQNIF